MEALEILHLDMSCLPCLLGFLVVILRQCDCKNFLLQTRCFFYVKIICFTVIKSLLLHLWLYSFIVWSWHAFLSCESLRYWGNIIHWVAILLLLRLEQVPIERKEERKSSRFGCKFPLTKWSGMPSGPCSANSLSTLVSSLWIKFLGAWIKKGTTFCLILKLRANKREDF